jgi:hypothetical protein
MQVSGVYVTRDCLFNDAMYTSLNEGQKEYEWRCRNNTNGRCRGLFKGTWLGSKENHVNQNVIFQVLTAANMKMTVF